MRFRQLLVGLAASAVIAGIALTPDTSSAKPRPTTTRPPTTTVAPTTTLPATTTTVAGSCVPGTPITVTSTTPMPLTGCYRSTNPAVRAVTIQTTQPVIFDHARIEHAGVGIYANWDWRANLEVYDTTFQQLPASYSQRAIYAYNTTRMVFEHNLLIDGAGVRWAGPDIDGSADSRVRYNKWVNIGRYGDGYNNGAGPGELIQAFQTVQIDFPGGLEVAWNEIRNTPGMTTVEDVMNLSITNGGAAAKVDVHHNLFDGSYRPPTTGPYQHTGSGIILGDQGGSNQRAHDNWFVATLNAGPSIPAGTGMEIDHNKVVVSGLVNGVPSGPDWGNGLTIWDNPSYAGVPQNNSVHDNVVGYNRLVNGQLVRSDYWLPQCGLNGNTCSNNKSLDDPSLPNPMAPTQAAEQAARDEWNAVRASNNVTIGPR